MSNVLNFFVNAGFSVSSICLCSVILFSYFLKNRAKKLEEKSIYFIIDLCAIILMSVVELIYVHHFIKFGMDSKYAVMLYHLYSITILLTTFFSWVFVLSYRFSLNNQIKEKKNNKYIFYSIIGVIEIIFGILIFIMPVNIHQNYGIYTFDSLPISIILVYVLISTTSFVFFLYYKNKTITTRDLIPSIVSLVFVCLILVYRLISRIDINIETFQLTIFVLGVFFTVENQDFKLIETAKQKQTAAENANDSQQEFLADMSHKIRSPINTILGLSQLILQEEKITKESIHDDAEKIKKASNDLLSLVENINNFSYLLADKSEVKKQAYDVPAALFELNSDIIADNPKNEIAFSYSINSSVPKQLIGDEDKISTLLYYIIFNAISHLEFGQITLSANGKKEKNIFELEYLISVSGANSKLEDFDIDTIDDSNLDYTSALGSEQLGLLIVKNLAKILNAKIGFTHEAGKDITYAILINQEIADSTSNASVDEIKPEQREEKFIEERQVEEKKEEPKEEEKPVEEAPAEEKKEEPEAKEEVKEEPKEEEKPAEEAPVEEKKEEPEAKEEVKEEPKEEEKSTEEPVEEKKEEPEVKEEEKEEPKEEKPTEEPVEEKKEEPEVKEEEKEEPKEEKPAEETPVEEKKEEPTEETETSEKEGGVSNV